MSQIEITPALLNDLEHKARGTCDPRWVLVNGNEVKPDHYRWSIAVFPDSDDAKFVAAANPAVVLALINQLDWQTAQHIEEIKNCIDLQKIIDDLKKEFEDLKDRCDC